MSLVVPFVVLILIVALLVLPLDPTVKKFGGAAVIILTIAWLVLLLMRTTAVGL